MSNPIRLPERLAPARQITARPPSSPRGVTPVGTTGQPNLEGAYATRAPGDAPSPRQDRGRDQTGERRSANPLLNLGIGIAARAAFGPLGAIVAAFVNFIIGPGRTTVDPTGTGDPNNTNLGASPSLSLSPGEAPMDPGVGTFTAGDPDPHSSVDVQQPANVTAGDEEFALPGPVNTETGAYTPEASREVVMPGGLEPGQI